MNETMVQRTARREHSCAVQAYYDRLGTPDKREWYHAVPCPEGGTIRIGDRYIEAEGDDQFHPSRRHVGCADLQG